MHHKTLKLSILLLSAVILQGCNSLNEAAGNFNRNVLDPMNESLDSACEAKTIMSELISCDEWYRSNGWVVAHDNDTMQAVWLNPNPVDRVFQLCQTGRYNCGDRHYKLRYNEIIKIGTKICRVSDGYSTESGFTENTNLENNKIQIRLTADGSIIWDDPLNWYACK